MKHTFFLLLIIIFFFKSEIKAQTATPPAGTGTITDPFLIASLENLYWVSTQHFSNNTTIPWSTGKYFKQTKDIDASETANISSWPYGWVPIGARVSASSGVVAENGDQYNRRAFAGVFDGRNFKITSLTIRTNLEVAGLFGYATGSIINVNLEGINYFSTKNVGSAKIGGLVGHFYGPNNRSQIQHCTVSGRIFSKRGSVGGLVGQLQRDNTIYCSTDVAINDTSYTGNDKEMVRIGGIVGALQGQSIRYCFAQGIIKGDSVIGGISGSSSINSTNSVPHQYNIANCTLIHIDSDSSTIGAIAGSRTITLVDNFYNKDKFPYAYKLSGVSYVSGGLSADELKARTNYPVNSNWDFSGFTDDGVADYWSFHPNDGFPRASNKYNRWIGSSSASFNTASNWSQNIVPVSSLFVGNNSNNTYLSNTVDLSASDTLAYVTLESGGNLNLSSHSLTLTGDLTNNGTISGSGTMELNGTSAQQISGIGTVNNIKINNTSGGVSIASGSNKLNITGLYTPTSGVLTTNGNLVFRSTVTQEGVVGTASTCPTEPISGDVTVEKYIPAKRAFRFLTPGVTTSSTINANWQEGSSVASTAGYPYAGATTENPTSGYGTHIMGAGGSTNGFDLSLSNNPSLFTFDVSSYAWVAEANTNDVSNVLKRGEGYRIFIRGDRSADLNRDVEDAIATTLRTTGELKVCESVSFNTTTSVVPLNSTASRYTFIGNPYWSVVDWHAVTKSNVENNVYYWDPTISGTNGRGAYITYNELTGNNTGGSVADRYIQPGQAFFVRNLSTVDGSSVLPSITFDHADIVGSSPTRTAIFGKKNNLSAGGELGMDEQQRVRGNAPKTIEKIYVSLLIKNKVASGPADGFLVAYNQGFTDTYGKEDAAKFSNLDENIAAVYNGSRQSILGLQSASGSQIKSDTIPISMSNLYDGEYLLKVSIDKSVSPVREVYVVNRVTKQQYKVDYTKGLELSFLNSITKTKDDLALVVNSQSIPNPVRTRKQLVVFPNPVTTGTVEVIVPNISGKMDMMNKPARVEIFSSNNQVVFTQNVTLDAAGKASFDISSLTSGGYVVRVYVDRNSFTTKLIKP